MKVQLEDTDYPLFILEKEDRMLLIFTTAHTLRQDGPKTPLWHMEFDRSDPVQDAVIWIGEREQLWLEWRRIAEEQGPGTLYRHISELQASQPIENAGAVLIIKHPDGLGLDIEVVMTNHNAEIASHRFASDHECAVFYDWLTGKSAEAKLWQLIERGCLQGSRTLHVIIDALTASEIDARDT